MLSALKGNSKKGFTLIELMIVIAIIGILAAIAVPNFILYRNKSFCSGAEEDAHVIGIIIANYFSEPQRTTLPTAVGALTYRDYVLSNNNKVWVGNDTAGSGSNPGNPIVIMVSDTSTRCPRSSTEHKYRLTMPRNPSLDGWQT